MRTGAGRTMNANLCADSSRAAGCSSQYRFEFSFRSAATFPSMHVNALIARHWTNGQRHAGFWRPSGTPCAAGIRADTDQNVPFWMPKAKGRIIGAIRPTLRLRTLHPSRLKGTKVVAFIPFVSGQTAAGKEWIAVVAVPGKSCLPGTSSGCAPPRRIASRAEHAS